MQIHKSGTSLQNRARWNNFWYNFSQQAINCSTRIHLFSPLKRDNIRPQVELEKRFLWREAKYCFIQNIKRFLGVKKEICAWLLVKVKLVKFRIFEKVHVHWQNYWTKLKNVYMNRKNRTKWSDCRIQFCEIVAPLAKKWHLIKKKLFSKNVIFFKNKYINW